MERVFGWVEPIAGLRKIKLRGLAHIQGLFLCASSAAFNLKRAIRLDAAASRTGATGDARVVRPLASPVGAQPSDTIHVPRVISLSSKPVRPQSP